MIKFDDICNIIQLEKPTLKDLVEKWGYGLPDFHDHEEDLRIVFDWWIKEFKIKDKYPIIDVVKWIECFKGAGEELIK